MLVTVAPGYALRVPDDGLDAARFDRLVNGVHRRLGSRETWWAPPALTGDAVRECLTELDEALALWRGTPYVDLEDAAVGGGRAGPAGGAAQRRAGGPGGAPARAR